MYQLTPENRASDLTGLVPFASGMTAALEMVGAVMAHSITTA
jgi:hypothetical protein